MNICQNIFDSLFVEKREIDWVPFFVLLVFLFVCLFVFAVLAFYTTCIKTHPVDIYLARDLREPVWPSGKTLGKQERPRFDSASALLSLH